MMRVSVGYCPLHIGQMYMYCVIDVLGGFPYKQWCRDVYYLSEYNWSADRLVMGSSARSLLCLGVRSSFTWPDSIRDVICCELQRHAATLAIPGRANGLLTRSTGLCRKALSGTWLPQVPPFCMNERPLPHQSFRSARWPLRYSTCKLFLHNTAVC